MHSIKPGRGPSAMGAVGGVVAVVFCVFWTIMTYTITKDAPTPIRVFFPLAGVMGVIVGIIQVIYNLYNASNKNRLSAFDITSGEEEPDPLNAAVGSIRKSTALSNDEETTENKLRELQELREKGLVTETEYSEQRRRILDSI